MDELLSVPSAAALTDLSQARVQAEAAVKIQKMAMDAGADQAAELLKGMGVGGNLDATG